MRRIIWFCKHGRTTKQLSKLPQSLVWELNQVCHCSDNFFLEISCNYHKFQTFQAAPLCARWFFLLIFAESGLYKDMAALSWWTNSQSRQFILERELTYSRKLWESLHREGLESQARHRANTTSHRWRWWRLHHHHAHSHPIHSR